MSFRRRSGGALWWVPQDEGWVFDRPCTVLALVDARGEFGALVFGLLPR